MKKMWIRFIGVLISLFLAFSAACARTPAGAADTTPAPAATPIVIEPATHKNVTLGDMAYTRPDTERIARMLDGLKEDISAGKPADELLRAYDEIRALYNDADSQASLAYLYYSLDVTEDYYKDEYTRLQSALSELDLAMTDASIALFESSAEAEQAARNTYGAEYVDTVYEDEALNSDQIRALEDAELDLVNQYDRLISTYTLEDGGKSWSYDDITSDGTLDYAHFIRLYRAYCAGLNEKAGALFLDLLDLRHQIAQKLGYGSFAAYRYAVYGRDYTVMDAKALQAAVKQYIVPVYTASSAQPDDALYDLYAESFDEETFFQQLADAVGGFSPEVSEALQYMRRNHLYDTTVSANKMEGSFTTYIASYEAPFLVTEWTGRAANLSTIIHELGHFTNYYQNAAAGWSAGDSLDLAEVDSQGLELLMMPYYNIFFGEDYGDAARRDLLDSAMYALITGCMEDEFQQTVYGDPSMTLDEINALYLRLAGEYGISAQYDYQGTEWVLINHTFQTPMYYISYAVSMTAALELYELMESGRQEQALSIYHAILNRAPYAAFREVTKEAGLGDAFDETTIQKLAELLKAKV